MKKEIENELLLKVRDDYNKIAGRFSLTRKKAFWGETDVFVKYIKEGDRVLDLGCGNGRLYGFLKEKSIDYTGIDNSEKLTEEAKKEWGESDSCRFYVEDILDFNDSKKYDVIFMIAVLHHIPGKRLRQEIIEKAERFLKKDGILVITNWNLFQKNYLAHVLKNIFLKIIFRSRLDFFDALIPWKNFETGKAEARRYVHAFTLRELRNLVKKSNFKIIENFYSSRGGKANPRNGWNLVTIAKK